MTATTTTIAKIVDILHGLGADVFQDLVQMSLACVVRAVAPVGIRHAPSHIPSADLVEMSVGSAHGGLDGKM